MNPTEPPEAEPQPALPPPEAPRAAPPWDSIGSGVLLALPWQVLAIVVTAPTMFIVPWGLIQWLALLPVFINRRRKGLPLAAKGILIAGFVGVLLNAGCAALILGNLKSGMH